MRKVVAILEVDEEYAQEYVDQNDLLEYTGPLDWVEYESKWMEDSGIRLTDAFVSDEDDESIWWRYLNYLADWIFNNHSEDNEGKLPMSYDTWREYENMGR